MFKYLWWRFIKFPGDFKNYVGIAMFGDKTQTMLVNEVNEGLKKIDQKIALNKEKIEETNRELDELDEFPKLGDDRFQRVQSSLRLFNIAFWVLVLSEFGLNYFTTYIMFDASKTGVFWLIMRLAISLTITGMAIIGAELLLEATFPHEIHVPKDRQIEGGSAARKSRKDAEFAVARAPQRDIGKIILFGAIFLMAEAVIYYVGLSRAHTFESGGVGSEVAVAMVLLSMVIPVGAGAVRWQRGKDLDAYQNRLREKKLTSLVGGLNKANQALHAQEANLFKEMVNKYWQVFVTFKVFKDNYNRKKQIEEKYLENRDCQFLRNFDVYQEEGHRRCSKPQTGDHKIAQSLTAATGKLD